MENKVATQLFGLFPKDHDSWRLKSASRDRTCGGAEEGGEENETNPADTVEKAARQRGTESAGVHLPSCPALQAPEPGSAVQA